MKRAELLGAVILVTAVHLAHGTSALSLPKPRQFGQIAAYTYDSRGRRDGTAQVGMERTGAGDILLRVDVRFDSGARTYLQARMAPTTSGRALRLVTERSWNRDARGALLAAMKIDHRAATATCTDSAHRSRAVALPRPDRVVNVPLNLFLLPLARGEVREERFQVLACGNPIRFIDARARVTARTPPSDGSPRLVRIRCRFELGPLPSTLAGPFLPKLVFWFDMRSPNAWAGYRAPLYTDGPNILLLRRPLRPLALETGGRHAQPNERNAPQPTAKWHPYPAHSMTSG